MKIVPLSEFMPYGAPELLGSSRRHMMRALLVSSALVTLSFVAIGIALMRMPPPVIVLTPDAPTNPHRIAPPPRIDSHDWVRPPSARTDQGKPIPVHENLTHPEAPPLPDAPTADPGAAPGTGAIGESGEPDPTTNSGDDPLPRIDEVVYFDEMPVESYRVEPVYPDIAKEARIQGLVYARMLVGRDGHVLDVQIAPKFSIPMLNEAVIVAARQWIFRPAMVNKHPVAVWVGVRFNFKLD